MNPVKYWQDRRNEPYTNTNDVDHALPIILDTRNATADDALLVSVQAVARFLLQEETITSPVLTPWLENNIRKVVRRAKDEKSWTKVESLPGLTTILHDTQVRVLFPHAVMEVPAEIKRLQVSGLQLPASENRATEESPHTLKIVINPDLEMTTGKLMAQTGHIAQLTLSLATETQVNAWVDAGFPVVLSEAWETDTNLVIHDAGHTEIPANSVTVKAFF